MRHRNRAHLCVVWDKDGGAPSQTKRPVYRKPIQLDFGFDAHANVIAFVYKEHLSPEMLNIALRRLKPTIVLDLRKFPRFDLPGYSRKKAFSAFEIAGSLYLALSHESGNDSLDVRVEKLIQRVREINKSFVGPILVLAESDEEIHSISRVMPKAKTGHWAVAIQRLGHGTATL